MNQQQFFETVLKALEKLEVQGRSDKHLTDVAGILRTQGQALDRAYLENWVRELGLEEPWQSSLTRSRGG